MGWHDDHAPAAAERFYQSTAWDDPPMLHSPELERTVPANGGVLVLLLVPVGAAANSIGCDGLNAIDAMKGDPSNPAVTPAPDCCYRFGGVVDKGEHCNAFIYYYPAPSAPSSTSG